MNTRLRPEGDAKTDAPKLLRLATAGSVDDGKSTLIGRLLHDTKSVKVDQLAEVEQVSRSRGLPSADLALLTDGLRAERDQGITIDVAYRYFATSRRQFVLADCPGHVQYTRNMVTGSSTADVVVLLVDARHGVVEQTRRHLAVAGLLRVPHVILVVNKIDLVGFDERIFREIVSHTRDIARRMHVDAVVHAVPVSALAGDNVVNRSNRTPWYGSFTLLELLESLPVDDFASTNAFRLPVQMVLRPQQAAVDDAFIEYRGYAGPVVQGTMRVGDSVTVLPGGRQSQVSRIHVGQRQVTEAAAPLSVAVELAHDIDICRGDVIVSTAERLPSVTRSLDATVCWLSDHPLRQGTQLLLKHLTCTTTAIVDDIAAVLDLETLQAGPSEALALNDLGRVRLRLAHPIVAETYRTSRQTGAFLLIDAFDGATLAAGTVDSTI